MKITITINDSLDGKVSVTSDPKFATLAAMINSGEKSTSAMGYAMLAIRVILEESKNPGPTKILLPKVSPTGRIIL